MGKKRRFERVPCNENVMVHYRDVFMEGILRDISLNGALVRFNEDMPMQPGEQCLITIFLITFDTTLHFLADVRHSQGSEAGVEFLFMDSDTRIYLESLLAFRAANPHLISDEFHFSLSHNGNPADSN